MKCVTQILLFLCSIGLNAQEDYEVSFRLVESDQIKLTNMRFYVALGNDSVVETEYQLIDMLEGKKTIEVKSKAVPKFLYFGTDSLTNVASGFRGDLDPINGMYWTWNTGFINLKLEGEIPDGEIVEWHIGGYQVPYSTFVKFPLNAWDKKRKKNLTIDLEVLLKESSIVGTRIMRPGNDSKVIFDAFIQSIDLE